MVTAEDVRTATRSVTTALPQDGPWDQRPAGLDWTCRETLAHVVRCVTNYAALLARRATGPVATPLMDTDAPVDELLDSLRSAGSVAAAVVLAAHPDDRAWHPAGSADASGVAAMACDEMLVHGGDIAGTLGVSYEPPSRVCQRVLHRLFPWAPATTEPWPALLWANGRRSFHDRPPERDWLWHCAPLDEWDGQVHRIARDE